MDESAVDDEKKPFEEGGGQDEDAQPDPDEHLMLDQGGGRVWLVKIPKFLMLRWAAINAEDVHLATVRVYNNPDGPHSKARLILFLPPNRNPNDPADNAPYVQPADRPVFQNTTSFVTANAEPDVYELEMINEAVENQIVVAERPKDPSFSTSDHANGPSAGVPHNNNNNNSNNNNNYNSASSRARTTILTGRIKHECNMKPAFNKHYRLQMRERHRKYNTPKRQIGMLDPNEVAGRGALNRLTSGMGAGGSRFGDFIKTKPKKDKGTFERAARMPRDRLLDLLFTLFEEAPRWSIKKLRERTQQPEAYLKELLQQIGFLNRSGDHTGLWELKPDFVGAKKDNFVLPPEEDIKMLSIDEEYDEDEEDEDEDMEEVS